MNTWESQQFLCLADYRSPRLRLRAFHSTTGELLWHEEIPIQLSDGVGELVVSDGALYVTDWKGSVVAIDARTRRILWHTRGTWESFTGLKVSGDIILLSSYKNILSALHTSTGQVLWTKQGQDNIHDFLWPVAGKALYMAAHERKPSTSSPGRVYALDPQTGGVLWQKHFPSDRVYAWKATDELVYAAYPPNASSVGMLYALNARDGSTVWTMQLVSGSFYPASVRGNVLYLIVIPHLLALDSRTGELLWSYEHELLHAHPLYHSITLLENWDYLLTCQRACESEHDRYDDCLYRLRAIDPVTGKLLRIVKSGRVWEGYSPTFFTSSRQPVVYLHTYSSHPGERRPNLFAIDKQDGRELWSTHLSYDDVQRLVCS